jgi:hypothetical protein
MQSGSAVKQAPGAVDSPTLDLYRYLRQGSPGGTVKNRSPFFGRIEDRAVAGAGKLSVLVGHRAALVRAHGRVGHELAVLQVDEHRRVSSILEIHSRARRDFGRPSDLLS